MNNPFHNPDHPIWDILHLTVVLGTLTLVLYMNAEHFDDTEIRTILTMFFALLGYKGISEFVKSKSK